MCVEIINAGKTGARFYESGSSCDRLRLFLNAKINQKRKAAEKHMILCECALNFFYVF